MSNIGFFVANGILAAGAIMLEACVSYDESAQPASYEIVSSQHAFDCVGADVLLSAFSAHRKEEGIKERQVPKYRLYPAGASCGGLVTSPDQTKT
jgi:hypothetical protein